MAFDELKETTNARWRNGRPVDLFDATNNRGRLAPDSILGVKNAILRTVLITQRPTTLAMEVNAGHWNCLRAARSFCTTPSCYSDSVICWK
jgi:hypothetical protein